MGGELCKNLQPGPPTVGWKRVTAPPFAWFSLTCSSTQNMQFQKIHAILMKKLCNLKVCYLVTYGCKNVNFSENGRFRYKIIVKTQPEMEFLEVATFIYLFSQKVGGSIPSATKIQFNTAPLYFMCSSEFFLKKPRFLHL